MKKILTIILLASVFLKAGAQTSIPIQANTLVGRLAGMKDDTTKLTALKKISKYYRDNDPDKSIQYANQGLRLAGTLNDIKGQCYFYSILGEDYGTKGNWDASLKTFNLQYQVASKANQKVEMSSALSDMGAVYNDLGDYVKAQDNYFKCLAIAEQDTDYVRQVVALSNIGLVYKNQFNYDKTLDYCKRSMRLIKIHHLKIPATEAGADVLLGSAYEAKKNYQIAREYHRYAIKIYQDINDEFDLATVYNDLMADYPADYSKILEYGTKAELIYDKLQVKDPFVIDIQGQIALAYIDMVRYNVWQNQHDSIPLNKRREVYLKKAEQYLLKGMQEAKQLKTNENLMRISEDLSLVYALTGKYKDAYDNLSLHDSIANIMFSQDSKNKIASLEGKHTIELRDKQLRINQLEIANQHKQEWVLVGGLVTLLIIGGLIYNQNLQRKKTNILLLQLNSELDEANKVKIRFFSILNHDLRSPLSGFVNFLHLQHEPYLLNDEQRSAYFKTAAESAEQLLNNMEDLLLWSKGQMENFKPNPRKIRVGAIYEYIETAISPPANITITFNNPEIELFTDEYYIKTIVFNLTNNAIKALGSRQGGTIKWNAWQEGETKYLSVTDNGPGAIQDAFRPLYDESAPIGIKHGLGLHIVRDLAKAINCKLSVNNSAGGVEIILTL